MMHLTEGDVSDCCQCLYMCSVFACLTQRGGLLHQGLGLFETGVALSKNSHRLLSNELQGIQTPTDHRLTLGERERERERE